MNNPLKLLKHMQVKQINKPQYDLLLKLILYKYFNCYFFCRYGQVKPSRFVMSLSSSQQWKKQDLV